MKKQFGALFLSLVMVIGCSSTALAAEVGIERNTFSEKAGEVVWITNSDIDTFDAILDTSPEVIDNFFDSQGILVVTGNNTDESLNLEEKLNLPVTAADTELAFASNDDAIIDPGIDIATIYYKHGNVFSVHEINVGSNDTVDRNALIEEVISEVKDNQAQPIATRASGSLIGEKDYTYTREPKGKMTAYYDVYTVQNFNSRDHYIIKANVTGMPGCDLGGAYETKYQGEDLDVTLSTSSSSVTVDDYGPERVANTGSVGVNVGGTLGEDISLELGLSWTQNTTDTNIDVSVSTSGVTWNTALSGGAQKAAFTFKPGINFQCPSNKSSVSVTANASYTLDSWDSGREEISLNKSFTCYPDRVS